MNNSNDELDDELECPDDDLDDTDDQEMNLNDVDWDAERENQRMQSERDERAYEKYIK